MNRPVINTVIGDSENVLVDGDVLITAADIEEAKFTKASRELEDIAAEAESNAFEQAEADGMDYPEAVAAGQTARDTVLQEGGARRTRVYSSRAARLQAQREAAEQRQKREDELGRRTQQKMEEERKFAAEQTKDSVLDGEVFATELYDWVVSTNPTIEEINNRKERDIRILSDYKYGSKEAVLKYRNILNSGNTNLNKFLELRGQDPVATEEQTGKLKADQPTKKKATKKKAAKKPAEEVPPKGGVGSSGGPTQAEVTPPEAPDTPTETAPVTAEDTEAVPATTPQGEDTTPAQEAEAKPDETATGRIEASSGAAKLYPNFTAYINDLKRLGMFDEAREAGLPLDEEAFIADREDKIQEFVEAPVQDMVRDVLSEGGEPYSSNAYGPGKKGVFYTDKDGVEQFRELKETDTEGKTTPPPDIAVTDVDEDQTQDQQIAEMRAKEQATVARETADQEADAEFQAGTDDTGPVVEDVEAGVDIPVVDTTTVTPDMTQADLVEDAVVGVEDTSETVIPEATTTGIELDKYESSVPNPQGVEAIVYEDPENPDSFIVESEGTVIRRESNKQDAILYADKMSEFVANREKKKARNAFVPRPEGKTYTGKFLKGLGRGTKALLAGTGKTGDSFRLSLDKNKRNIADNNNIPYDDTTTEEDLYDALYAKYIAPKEEAAPTEVVEPVDIAGEVQEEAERIVASDYDMFGNKINKLSPETIDEYSSDDEVDANLAARAARQEYAETGDPSALIDVGWDDADAEIRAEEEAEAKERAERTAENRAVKLTPGYWTEMLDTNTALKDISKTKSQGGFEISELRTIADNILKADPSFVYNKEGTRKEIEAAIKSYIIKDVEPVEDNSPYVDKVDDDTGIISTEYKESRIDPDSVEEPFLSGEVLFLKMRLHHL
jgi:hypothetical protein